MAPKREYVGRKGLDYYRDYPRDFFEGTVGLPGELKGFYALVLKLMYLHDGYLLEDLGHISGQTGYGKAKCRNLLSDLVARGKIDRMTLGGEPHYSKKRVRDELKDTRNFSQKQAQNAAGGKSASTENKQLSPRKIAEKRKNPANLAGISSENFELELQENNNLGSEVAKPLRDYETIKKGGTTSPPKKVDELAEAFSAYNETAEALGLPKAQVFTDPRRAKLRARLKECGGLDGWKIALGMIPKSSLLSGRKTNWRADFDFLLQQKSFTKLLEGAYNDHHAPGNGGLETGRRTHADELTAASERIADALDRGR